MLLCKSSSEHGESRPNTLELPVASHCRAHFGQRPSQSAVASQALRRCQSQSRHHNLKSEMNSQNANDRFLKLKQVQDLLGVSGTTLAAGASFRCVACPDMAEKA